LKTSPDSCCSVGQASYYQDPSRLGKQATGKAAQFSISDFNSLHFGFSFASSDDIDIDIDPTILDRDWVKW
jgi:hypothetical protein